MSDRMAALAPQGIIVGNGVEANVILNLAPRGGRVDPYLFAGLGFTRFSLVHENTYDRMLLRNGDSAFVLPAGAGASVRLTDAVLLDARLTFRTVFDDGMMYLSMTPGRSALNMSQWAASARLVFEF
jgi:opacity protein-like surface antigen